MPERDKKFHEFLLQTTLFRGRGDWYFCYLKSEKIAQVLFILLNSATGSHAENLRELALAASKLPESVVRFAAGEIEQRNILADILSILSAVRFCVVQNYIGKENGLLFVEEYEGIAQKLGSVGHPSPFVAAEDFSIPPLGSGKGTSLKSGENLKDIYKGHPKGQGKNPPSTLDAAKKEERLARILDVIRKLGGASIKDISTVVKEYSEKTIQRELMALISQGLVRREGERRWSVYRPVSEI